MWCLPIFGKKSGWELLPIVLWWYIEDVWNENCRRIESFFDRFDP